MCVVLFSSLLVSTVCGWGNQSSEDLSALSRVRHVTSDRNRFPAIFWFQSLYSYHYLFSVLVRRLQPKILVTPGVLHVAAREGHFLQCLLIVNPWILKRPDYFWSRNILMIKQEFHVHEHFLSLPSFHGERWPHSLAKGPLKARRESNSYGQGVRTHRTHWSRRLIEQSTF